VNVAPATDYPRAARRTSCLGTFLLVVVLWTFSMVALVAYLVTRSLIQLQVRVAWWAVFLAAAAVLTIVLACSRRPATAWLTCSACTFTPGGCCCTATEPGRC
jgi:hypothetical protein